MTRQTILLKDGSSLKQNSTQLENPFNSCSSGYNETDVTFKRACELSIHVSDPRLSIITRYYNTRLW